MTTEQKAKAYDQAIKRAKGLFGDTIIEESGQHIAEIIFPELKSEKERIAACIGLVLSDAPEDRFKDYNVSLKQCYDWLAKQKNLVGKYEDDLEICASANFSKGYQLAIDDCNLYKSAEWSEHDESMRTRCLGALAKCHIGQLPDEVEEEIKWLHSLNPKNYWKPTKTQLEALLWCVVHLGGADKQTLGELLEQLHKL